MGTFYIEAVCFVGCLCARSIIKMQTFHDSNSLKYQIVPRSDEVKCNIHKTLTILTTLLDKKNSNGTRYFCQFSAEYDESVSQIVLPRYSFEKSIVKIKKRGYFEVCIL